MARTLARHEAIERHLRSRVASSAAGDQIESDADLCEMFKVSRMTVRQATQRLVSEGLIYRVSGVGTFVAEPRMHRQTGELRSFTDEMALRGFSVHSKVLALELRAGTKDETTSLLLPTGSTVVHVRRLRLAGDEPMAIEDVALPPDFSWLLTYDLASSSLHKALTDRGFEPVRAVGDQRAIPAAETERELLMLPPGAALFLEQRLVFTADDVPIERTVSRYAGPRFVFHIELSRHADSAVDLARASS